MRSGTGPGAEKRRSSSGIAPVCQNMVDRWLTVPQRHPSAPEARADTPIVVPLNKLDIRTELGFLTVLAPEIKFLAEIINMIQSTMRRAVFSSVRRLCRSPVS